MNILTILNFMNWQSRSTEKVLLIVLLAWPTSILPQFTLKDAHPRDPTGTVLYAAREAAHLAGGPDTFKIKADIWIDENGSPTTCDIQAFTVEYPGTSVRPFSGLVLTGALALAPISDGLDNAFSLGDELPVPLPPQVDISIFFDPTVPNPCIGTFDVSFPLEFYENATAVGSHIFPMLAADLDDVPAGAYWNYGSRHVDDGFRGAERYAYDIGAVQWYVDRYIGVKLDPITLLPLPSVSPNALNEIGAENKNHLAWGRPVYAAADGVVVNCTRGNAENSFPCDDNNRKNTPNCVYGPRANELWIQHGDELMLYTHIQADNMLDQLCPFTDTASHDVESMNIQVVAGQQLGLIGNNGGSTAPHLHTSVYFRPDTSIPYPNPPTFGSRYDRADSRPLNYHNVRIASDPTSINNLGDNPPFRRMHGRILPSHTLVIANPCGFEFPESGFPEVMYWGVPIECYQDLFNMVVSRGYRPVWVDGNDANGETFLNVGFRPSGPATISHIGMTGPDYQALFDDLTAPGSGYRLHQVDSYLQSGTIRYAAIFEIREGPNFSAFHGLTDAEYNANVAALDIAGYVPVNVSTVELGGQQYWTGLFEEVPADDWTVDSVSIGLFQDTFDANHAAGMELISVNGFTTSAGPYLTGVWVNPMGASSASSASHGLTNAELQTAWEDNRANNRFTRYVTAYEIGDGSARLAAVWRERPDTILTQTPPAETNQTTATFRFEADNPFTTFQCVPDLTPLVSCTSPFNMTSLAEGYHTALIRALDRELMWDASPLVHAWLVDITPPTINIAAPVVNTKTVKGVLKDDEVDMTTIIGWADVVADVNDALTNVASVGFKVNGIPVPETMVDADSWKIQFVPHLKGENVYLVEVRATDDVGNFSTASISITGVRIGKPPP